MIAGCVVPNWHPADTGIKEMKNKHTPGPWAVTESDNPFSLIIRTADNRTAIAHVYSQHDGNERKRAVLEREGAAYGVAPADWILSHIAASSWDSRIDRHSTGA